MIITGYLNAQKNFNTDNVEIVLRNNLNKSILNIESNLFSTEDSTYIVRFTTHRFIKRKRVINIDSTKVNKTDILPIQEILLNLDNHTFNKKNIPCLDGLSITIKFYDKLFHNSVEQRFSCINSTDEVYKSIVKIYSFFPFKEELL